MSDDDLVVATTTRCCAMSTLTDVIPMITKNEKNISICISEYFSHSVINVHLLHNSKFLF